MKAVNKAIEKTLKGLDSNAYQSLLSISGIEPVMAAGILAEIGYIDAFKSQDTPLPSMPVLSGTKTNLAISQQIILSSFQRLDFLISNTI